MTTDEWPPDWRARAAEHGDAVLARSGQVLAELDELCELFPPLAQDARALAAKLRCERDDLREQTDAYRLAAAADIMKGSE